ncbi:hypothetical protein [Streptomyces sp. NPDC086989]|uniref:hypothetical protein n=1 Tax=Streptomyces sp. NPDC086989 TaxID=3365764 RepID=UPI00381D5DA2
MPGFVPAYSDLDATGRTLMAAADTNVEFWNVETGTKTGSYTAPARIHRVDLSDDGTTAAVSTDDAYTRVLDVAVVRPRDAHTFPTPKMSGGYWSPMKLSPSGSYLLGETLDADMKSTLTVWETRTADPHAAPRLLPRHPLPAVRGQAGHTEPACRGLLKPHGEDRAQP